MKKVQNIMYGALVTIIIILIVMKLKSGYSLSPESISIKPAPGSGGSIFDLPYTLACTPGSDKRSSAYTKSLTPGGICGAQEFVVAQSNYTITGGIGGNLLD